MQLIPIHKAKNDLSALLHAVEMGDEVFITRHGKKLAQLVYTPELDGSQAEKERLAQEALQVLEKMRTLVAPGPALDWQELRDAGRKY